MGGVLAEEAVMKYSLSAKHFFVYVIQFYLYFLMVLSVHGILWDVLIKVVNSVMQRALSLYYISLCTMERAV